MKKGQLIKLLQESPASDDTLVLARGGDLPALTADISAIETGTTPDIDSEDDNAEVPAVFLILEEG